jgi:hypothetical protein
MLPIGNAGFVPNVFYYVLTVGYSFTDAKFAISGN